MTTKERYTHVLQWFEENMPVAESELNFTNPYELLVAVMLSAQCTDKRVNIVTPALFNQYPDAKSLAQATEEEIFQHIRSISYPNSKAKHLSEMAKMLCERFHAEVPDNIEELMQLPGVGRKTANVVTAVAFNRPAMPVDTHVFRVANRIGLTRNSKTPRETEATLCKHIPSEILGKAHHWLLLHGRYVCTARNPHCEECGLQSTCQFVSKKK